MFVPSLAALLFSSTPGVVAMSGPGFTCKTTYDCCVQKHGANAVEQCNHLRDTPTLPEAPLRPKPVKTADPVKAPEPPPTKQPDLPRGLGPDVFVLPKGDLEEAVRRTGDKKPAPEPRLPEPEVRDAEDLWEPVPGEPPWRPCGWRGTGGPGPFKPKGVPATFVRCSYQCGRYAVKLYWAGKAEDDCLDPNAFKKAEKLAKEFHKSSGNGR
ncbi:MAG TPA: hypothetical protein VK447_16490 [Myxococcaceae bacterium]|nr:hypothetical protein [Myxococcaceae bacterium]